MSNSIFNSVKALFLFALLFMFVQLHAFSQISLVKACQMINGGAYLCEANGKLFFAADDTVHGYEPWVSDGTPAGTHLLKDIQAGTPGGMFFGNTYAEKNSSIVYKNKFYFIADDGAHGFEIWKSDGTDTGTSMLKDINHLGSVLGSGYNNYPYFCIANGSLYFQGDDNTHGSELWKTDGTSNGTVMVKDIYDGYIGSEPFSLTTFKNKIFFRAWGENTNRELWRSDGTDTGTVLVKDIRKGLYGSFTDASSSVDPHFTVSGNYLYFRAITDSLTFPPRLWRTDGTAAGTIQLENHLKEGFLYESYNVAADVDGTFYFLAADNTPSYLWKSDGTPSGTVNVTTNNDLSAIAGLYNFNGTLVFDGHDNSGDGLCRSNGSAAGSYMVKTFPGLGSSATAGSFSTDGNYLYFGVLEAINSSAMEWRIGESNGTTAGTIVFPHYGFFSGFTPLNGKMYYAGYDTIISSSYVKFGLYELIPIGVGVNEIHSDENISVYPNPAGESVTLEINQPLQNGKLEIVNLLGSVIYAQSVPDKKSTIDLKQLSPGIYFIHLQSDNLNMVRKFVRD